MFSSKKSVFYLLLPLFLLLSACGSKKVPEDVLTPRKIQPILLDMHLIDSGLSKQVLTLKEREKKRTLLYNDVLARHELDRQLFYDSYEYYLTRPDLLDSIYTRIIDDLNHMVPVEQEKQFQDKKKGKKK